MNYLPDRLSAIASEAYNRGATTATHNLGGLHADIHHCTIHAPRIAPAHLADDRWSALLERHRTT